MSAEPDPRTGAALVDGCGLWCEILRGPRGAAAGPALFLDRDGVLVEEVNYLARAEDVALIPGAADTVRACNAAGIPVVVATNQSGIGRGYFGWDAFAAVEARIRDLLAAEGAALDAVLACAYHDAVAAPYCRPDHPWRKPGPGMLRHAAEALGLDLARSWIVGDKASDLEAGRAAGLAGGIAVQTGHGPAHISAGMALARPGFQVRLLPSLAAVAAILPELGLGAALSCR